MWYLESEKGAGSMSVGGVFIQMHHVTVGVEKRGLYSGPRSGRSLRTNALFGSGSRKRGWSLGDPGP